MTDAYEREEMPGVGAVLHRQKVTSPRWAVGVAVALPSTILGVTGIITAILGGPLLGAGLVVGSLALAALNAFLMVTFATARIAVSEGEVHIQIGMAGPKIPIASVERVELAPSGIRKVGMGVGSDLNGTTWYRMWGNNDKAVHLHLEGGKRIVVVCKEPEALFDAVQHALARGERPKVRVAEEPVSEDEERETAEATRKKRV